MTGEHSCHWPKYRGPVACRARVVSRRDDGGAPVSTTSQSTVFGNHSHELPLLLGPPVPTTMPLSSIETVAALWRLPRMSLLMRHRWPYAFMPFPTSLFQSPPDKSRSSSTSSQLGDILPPGTPDSIARRSCLTWIDGLPGVPRTPGPEATRR